VAVDLPVGFVRTPLAQLDARRDCIMPASPARLPTVIAWSNLPQCGDPVFAARMLHGVYRARDVTMDPVHLAQLPRGALLAGDSFMLLSQDQFVIEQINPLMSAPEDAFRHALHPDRPILDVTADCLLLPRYGADVWGHWLGELLPRAVLAEAVHPGRFTYVVPEHTTLPGVKGRSLAHSVMESLQAYGIGPERLLRVSPLCSYRFQRLTLAEGVWSQAVPHPKIIDLMRSTLRQPVPKGRGRKLAILRRDTANRGVFNAPQVADRLAQAKFRFAEMAQISFIEQVAAFREAETVFGVLGSGLTGLIYAPDGARVITAAPAEWFDFFFYVLMQLRQGVNAEIRGHSLWRGDGLKRDAPIVVNPADLEAALACVAQNLPALAPDGMLRPAGIALPRWLGPVVQSWDFGAGGNGAACLGESWSVQEAQHVWSLGPRSTLRLPAPAAEDGLMLEFRLATFTRPVHLPCRHLQVNVNGMPLLAMDVADVMTIGCPLPRACLENADHLDIELLTPVCPPASVLGMGTDLRPLGVGLMRIDLRRASGWAAG
jgi:hypothetical protein